MRPYGTTEEFREAFNALTPAQQAWVLQKAAWERLTLWAVMNDWDVPKDSGLRNRG